MKRCRLKRTNFKIKHKMSKENKNAKHTGDNGNDFIADVSKSLLIDVLIRYEQWEANLIMEASCWEGGMPTLTTELFEELLEIQELRNKALGNVC